MKALMRSDGDIIEANTESAYIGGSYFEEAKEAQQLGRMLLPGDELIRCQEIEAYNAGAPNQSYFLATLFAFLSRQLRPGEMLFGLYQHVKGYLIAPYLQNEERLADFELQVFQGTLKRVSYIALLNHHVDRKMNI